LTNARVALDELAKMAFESDAERKEYEQMLERRFEYLAEKRRERNQQWSQYWPADKPETLVRSSLLPPLYIPPSIYRAEARAEVRGRG
jgi:hypothetical protein